MTPGARKLTQQMFQAEKRRAERDDLQFPTRLFHGEAFERAADVDVVNLSPCGFMVRADFTPPEHSIVQIELPMLGRIEATVVWSLGGRIGGEFPMLPHDRYRPMLDAARLLGPRWRVR